MIGIEIAYLDAAIEAAFQGNKALFDTSIADAIHESYVPLKGDTLGLDQRPESAIARVLRDFDQYAIIISEEGGEYQNPLATSGRFSVQGARTFYGCDPCDRSGPLKDFLTKFGKEGQRVADVISAPDAVKKWEASYGAPATITGSNSALTCVRRGMPICSVILNFITQEITVVSSAGIFHVALPKGGKNVNFEYIKNRGSMLYFPNGELNDPKRLVTFMGKPERGYPRNFLDSKMVAEYELDDHIHHREPGGPNRVLYLSELQPKKTPIGFIMANGEKFGEWIHWLPFTKFARRRDDLGERALRIFETAQDQSLMRDGYLMTPSPAYSIFVTDNDGHHTVIDVDKLRGFDNPSKYRSTLIVVPSSNEWAIDSIGQYGYRELEF